jgi:hypothetical protein
MSGTRFGQGRSYVHLGRVKRLDFAAWCAALARGRSYVSDGYAHALALAVEGKTPGETLALARSGEGTVRAKVAFAAEMPLGVAHGEGPRPRSTGDTVTLHGPRPDDDARKPGG